MVSSKSADVCPEAREARLARRGKGAGRFPRWSARVRGGGQRLLILCYHGISLEQEHEWRPPLFMTPEVFRGRLEILRRGGFSVLPLADALRGLYAGDLPERSVAITFDDGNFDFYAKAYPLLEEYGYPATVYLTTYYADHELPVFHLICSYVLWKHRRAVVSARDLLGAQVTLDLRTPEGRDWALAAVVEFADREELSAREKDQLARSLAALVGEDADALWEKRVLQLMNPDEVAELAGAGVDFQLHTHRHRSPVDRSLYRKELRDNRGSIQQKTGSLPVHFCYPSGVYRSEFLPWLNEERIESATTCDPGFASPSSDPLLLPRAGRPCGPFAARVRGLAHGRGHLSSGQREACSHPCLKPPAKFAKVCCASPSCSQWRSKRNARGCRPRTAWSWCTPSHRTATRPR